jgi:hypothetical protein
MGNCSKTQVLGFFLRAARGMEVRVVFKNTGWLVGGVQKHRLVGWWRSHSEKTI